MTDDQPLVKRGRGRPPVSSREEIDAVALDLFLHNGFTETSVAQICLAAYIGRTTFFRYYPSKASVVWSALGPFASESETRLRAREGSGVTGLECVLGVVVDDLQQMCVAPRMRDRLVVIAASSELRAAETEQWRSWRQGVASFLARPGADEVEVVRSRVVADAMWSAYRAALHGWADAPDMSLEVDSEMVGVLVQFTRALQLWLTTPGDSVRESVLPVPAQTTVEPGAERR